MSALPERLSHRPVAAVGDPIALAFENARHAIIVVDVNLVVVAANRAARLQFEDQQPGRSAQSPVRPMCTRITTLLNEDPQIQRLAKEACATNTRLVYRLRKPGPFGSLHTALEFSRITMGRCKPLVSIEFQPRRLTLAKFFELQDELKRQQSFARLQRNNATRLAQANEMLNRFAFAAAHDIQEPVRIISILSDLLSEEGMELAPDEFDDLLDQIGRQARRVRKIVVDVLEFSRVRENDPQYEQVDLNALIENVFDLFHDRIADHLDFIDVRALGTVEADAKMLSMLFQNLISNAIKYQGDGGLALTLTAERRQHEVEICVADKGIGFDPQCADSIFEIFTRLHREDEIGGTGIGLALCKSVVQAHHGDIWAVGKPGEGAAFHIRLPRYQTGHFPNDGCGDSAVDFAKNDVECPDDRRNVRQHVAAVQPVHCL